MAKGLFLLISTLVPLMIRKVGPFLQLGIFKTIAFFDTGWRHCIYEVKHLNFFKGNYE